jgi:hypothetical protein
MIQRESVLEQLFLFEGGIMHITSRPFNLRHVPASGIAFPPCTPPSALTVPRTSCISPAQPCICPLPRFRSPLSASILFVRLLPNPWSSRILRNLFGTFLPLQ